MTNLPTTIRALIERSMAMHPSTFEEGVRRLADQHRSHAAATYNENAARSARCMAFDCDTVARNLAADDIETILAERAQFIPAATVAAKLQCLPPFMLREMMPSN